MLRGKRQAAAVLGLVLLGVVVGGVTVLLGVEPPWTYVVVAVVAAVAVLAMMRRFHR